MPFDGVDTTGATIGILRYARQQIAAGSWVQGDYGRHGSYCALGWVHRAGDGPGPESRAALLSLGDMIPYRQRTGGLVQTIIDYNDSHTQRGVVRWFDRAIAALERRT